MRRQLVAFMTCLAILGLLTWVVFAQEAAPATEKAAPAKTTGKAAHKKVEGAPAVDMAKIPPRTPRSKCVQQPDGRLSPNTTPQFPATAELYKVQKGDTLWKVSGDYLKNCYLWPQLWEKNMHVKNPHWIYPGDELLVGAVKLVDRAAAAPAEASAEERPICERKTPFKDPLGLLKSQVRQEEEAQQIRLSVSRIDAYYGTERELYGTGIVYDSCPKFDNFIVGAENEGFMRNLAQGQVVYLNMGDKDGVKLGDRFHVIRSCGEIRHPERGYKVGYYFQQLGTVKILIVRDKHSVAYIDWSAKPMFIGDAIIPFQERELVKKDISKDDEFSPRPKELREGKTNAKDHPRFAKDNDKAKGSVVFIEDKMRISGTGNVVYIDLGKGKDITPGQHLLVYEKLGDFHAGNEYYPDFGNEDYKEHVAKRFKDHSEEATDERHVPRLVTGELVIIDVFEKTAKAVVVNARLPVQVGSYVQLQ